MVRSRREQFALVVASLFVCSLLAPAVATGVSAGGVTYPGAETTPTAVEEFQTDRTEFQITVYENGSAEWLFRYELGLRDSDDRESFQAFAEEFNDEETELYTNFRERATSLIDVGSEATDREMGAENFQRDARIEGIENDLGVVEMSFRWEAFARTEDAETGGESGGDADPLVVGDVFEGGLYLGPDQRLVIRTGPDLAFEDVQPDDGTLSEETVSDSDTVTWEGERSFTDSRPRVVVTRAETSDEAAPSTGDGSDSEGTSTPVVSDSGWLLPIGAFVVVVIVGVGAAAAYRSGALPSRDDHGATATRSAATGADVASEGTIDAVEDVDAAPAVSEEELVSDEERVVNMLEENGGRMKQVNIVDETGWSKSKVSMLLSDMEDDGTISKLRVGRENIVSLAGHEPDAAGSPFDDEA